MEKLFFGYSSQPSDLRAGMADLAAHVADHPNVASAVTWEDLRVDGRLIVQEIEREISAATLGIFEVSTMNNNVLFELGFAIGQGKRIAILLNSADREAHKRWSNFGLLTTTGYTGYQSLDQLRAQIAALLSQPPKPLLEDLLQGADADMIESRLLYVPSFREDESSRSLSRTLAHYEGFEVQRLDLDEYGGAPLEWFTQEVYCSRFGIFHLTPSRAYLSDLMNARTSFLAGLARGIGRQVVFASDETEYIPLDYRDLALKYSNPKQLARAASAWLEGLRGPRAEPRASRVRRHISAELSSLRFGNHVAESDERGLESYFVETRDYQDVLDAAAVIFTGKKGTGKTANMLQAAQNLRDDRRNLVCVIKPASYELEALLAVLAGINSRHLSDFLIEALWKYLIYTEVATRAIEEAEARPAGIAKDEPLDHLREMIDGDHFGVGASFSVRLERLVASLRALMNDGVDESSINESRHAITTALYGGTLKSLRSGIGVALSKRQRVAILIDNLDKAWERGADLELLARLLLGLLTVVGRIVDEFNREAPTKDRVNVTLTVFLRSDIFAFVRDRAREPDKITVAEIEWRDPDLLARVLEDRFLVDKADTRVPEDLWNNYFVPEIQGMSSRDYVLSRVQPRPRDLVVFANAAVVKANNAKHARIEESDVLEAESIYSQFAYEALLVEGVASSVDLEPVLLEFAGEPSIIDSGRVKEILEDADSELSTNDLLTILRRLGFLGIETTEGFFDYGGTDGELRRADVLARKLAKTLGRSARFEIHPAYRAYLEILERKE